MRFGATPRPVQTPAVTVFDDVTKGYDPKSTSSSVPCAPSASTDFSCARQPLMKYSLSMMRNRLRYSTASNHRASSSAMSYR